MSELPPAAQARIERIRADLELAVIDALKQRPKPPPMQPWDRLVIIGPLSVPIQPLVLDAFRDIVAVISALPWTATDRRQAVTKYQDELRMQYLQDKWVGPSFVEQLRKQSWWITFQQELRQAERTDVPPIPQQLKMAKDASRLTEEQIATATGLTKRTVQRHLSGELPPRAASLMSYEKVFKITLITPAEPRPRRRRRAAKKPPTRR